MFGWLAKWLIKAPVVGSSCVCCEAKKAQLKQMQKTILGEDDTDEGASTGGCGCENCGCGGHGKARAEEDVASEEVAARAEDMTTSYRYKL